MRLAEYNEDTDEISLNPSLERALGKNASAYIRMWARKDEKGSIIRVWGGYGHIDYTNRIGTTLDRVLGAHTINQTGQHVWFVSY